MSLDKGKGTGQTKEGQPVQLEETGWGVVTGGGLMTKERKHSRRWEHRASPLDPTFLQAVTWLKVSMAQNP